MRPAVFLDKDGTLLENVPWNVDPARMRLAPGAAVALARLHAAGFLLVVVSNQAGVAQGRFPESALQAVDRRLHEMVAGAGAVLADFLWCPHAPESGCACRKPAPGMLRQAATRHGIDLAASWMVGDILDDVEAGLRAGCRTALVDNGGETEWLPGAMRVPHVMVQDLEQAARCILHERARVAA